MGKTLDLTLMPFEQSESFEGEYDSICMNTPAGMQNPTDFGKSPNGRVLNQGSFKLKKLNFDPINNKSIIGIEHSIDSKDNYIGKLEK